MRLAIQECGRRISKHIRQIKRSEENLIKGKKKAVIHSLLLREINRFAGKKVADIAYAEAFGFDDSLAEVIGEYELDVWKERAKARVAVARDEAIVAQ